MTTKPTGTGGVAAARGRQRFLAEYATDIIYTTDELGRFVHFNPHAHTILGYSRQELLGRHYLDLVWPEYRELTRRFYGRQFIKQIHSTYREVPCAAKDGALVWLGQNVQFLYENGQSIGFQAVARDVTARVRNEEMAARQAALLELIARDTPLDLVLERVCRSFEELAPGFRATILAEQTSPPPDSCWSTIILSPKGESGGVFALHCANPRTPAAHELELVSGFCDLAGIAIDRARAEKEVHRLHVELEARVADRTRELEETNLRLQSEIVERHRTEQELLHAKKLESVGRLAGGVAHEFNNWLTVIMLYTEELGEQLRPDEAAATCLEEIRRAAQRASSLTRQLLAFGRQQMLQPKLIDLNALLSNLTNVLRSIMGSGIRLRMDLMPFVGTVRADPSQIEQVMVNLALNARDAMPEGGVFVLRTTNTLVGESSASGVPPGEYVLIEASDTGVGMDTATRERIFEPFFTTKQMGKGSGLGLATVYGVIQQSGGQILVRSAPDRGATFQIYLPLLRETPKEPERLAPPPAAWGSKRVLVVDDDAIIRRLVSQSLRRLAFQVEEAANAAAAEAILESGRTVDLLITDIVMPGRNGVDLAAWARTRYPNLAVLFVSAYASNAMDRFGASVDSEAYLGKPFSTLELAEKVRQMLAARGQI